MRNYLFEDLETGERFFVQCDSYGEAIKILTENDFSIAECRYLGDFSDEEAEWYGYDTY